MLTATLMTPFEGGLLYAALGAFGGASVVGLRVVGGSRRGRPLRPMLAVGLVLLTLFLITGMIRQGDATFGQRHEVLLGAAWAIGLGAWFVSRRANRQVLAAVTAPTLALLTLFGLLLVPREATGATDPGIGRTSHIVLAVLGFAGFSISAGVGVLYLWQIRMLKRDPTAAVARRMPALERLDRVNFVAAACGAPCLALSLVAGWLFLGKTTQSWWLDPTILAALGGLLVYAALFAARGVWGWYGRRIAWLSVIGFIVAVGGFVVAAFCTSKSVLHG